MVKLFRAGCFVLNNIDIHKCSFIALIYELFRLIMAYMLGNLHVITRLPSRIFGARAQSSCRSRKTAAERQQSPSTTATIAATTNHRTAGQEATMARQHPASRQKQKPLPSAHGTRSSPRHGGHQDDDGPGKRGKYRGKKDKEDEEVDDDEDPSSESESSEEEEVEEEEPNTPPKKKRKGKSEVPPLKKQQPLTSNFLWFQGSMGNFFGSQYPEKNLK